MSTMLPVAVYGLEVPAGDIIVPAVPDFPATFRITMAAIDPSSPGEFADGDAPARATLKLLRQPLGPDDEDDDEDDEDDDELEALLNGLGSDDESSDEDVNGGPSDPAKSKKARKEAALAEIKKALEEDDDDEMEVDDAVNGLNGALEKARKGKARATGEEESSEEEDDDDSEDLEIEEFVLCTLDPAKNYQQPLDITVAEDERVFFKVSGTHTVYLTGNYVIPPEEAMGRNPYDSEDDEEDYDLSPDEDELDDYDEDDESDELDDLEDPRITEVDTDEEAPKLVKAEGKGKKRAAEESEDEGADLDSIVAKSLKPEAGKDAEPKLSKKQQKKLKNNAGEAVPSAAEKSAKDSPATAKSDKKVQFAKNLEQGPTPTKDTKADKAQSKKEESKKDDSSKKATEEQATLGPKTVKGVKIDDKKLGKGPRAKPGDRLGMRYIGKFKDGKVFDSNKKGEPFKFKLGAGEVIKGWDIGIAGMAPGGERRIVVPPSLAYGSKPPPGIPANAELTFDVKLLTVNGK